MADKESESTYATYFEPPKTFVKSAIRVLGVLEFFYRNRQPARAVEIGRTLNLPVSSTKYLLTSMVDSGYMVFDKESKTYFPSILFTGFASWLSEIYPSGEVLRRLAKATHEQLGNIVSIAVQHEGYMRSLTIEMEGTSTPPSYDFRVRIPMVGSAGGLVALAALTDEQLAEFVTRQSHELPPDQRGANYESVLADVRQTRRRGFAIQEHTVQTNGQAQELRVVAIPIPVAERSPSMALAVTGEKIKIEGHEAEIADKMKRLLEDFGGLL